MNDDGELEEYLVVHALKTNKTRSSEYVEAGGEQSSSYMTFTLRWFDLLSSIEFAMPDYRLEWRGVLFDIIGYDDFMQQHRKVDLACRSLGSGPYA